MMIKRSLSIILEATEEEEKKLTVAAHKMKRALTSGKGALRATVRYLVPQNCTPVTVKYSAVLTPNRYR